MSQFKSAAKLQSRLQAEPASTQGRLVLLGINHNIPEIEPPLWFESMVFRESADGTHGVRIKYDTLRYSTVADALAGHLSICEKVKSGEIGE